MMNPPSSMTKEKLKVLLKIHLDLIGLGHQLEREGQLSSALLVALACVDLTNALRSDSPEEQAEIEAIKKILPLVVDRIKAHMDDSGVQRAS